MASMETKEVEFENKELKHLGFVRVAAIRTLVYVSYLYEFAKQNYGPFRSTVGTVEGAVTTVVSPIYERFKDVPDLLLVFLDKKVDEASHRFEDHVPAKAKQVIYQVQDLLHKTAQHARKLGNEARTIGPRGAVRYAAGEYKQLLVVWSSKLWVKLNDSSTFHSMAKKVVPMAANLSGKYNGFVNDMSGKGYPLFGYLPLIPVDELSKQIKEAEAKEKEHLDDDKSDSIVAKEEKEHLDDDKSDSTEANEEKEHLDDDKSHSTEAKEKEHLDDDKLDSTSDSD
ncbi:DNA-binding HORMA family protein [Hibiscus syriacus]|uniref:DNA-binding HORMA family protein n=1 Tax=Hibiscus syriacus TaxID=106335 RepID=A0A6A2ZLF7_HIBSY|nr:REF/SRPP-like protein At1g67360 [Hibiscus syriacus]KAE8692583.1 DNA-binding HORMA family protein [Hibiscus syriacus]